MLCALAMPDTATTATVGLFVTALVAAFVTTSSNTVVKSYSVMASTFIQKTKKGKKQKKKWSSGLDQNQGRIDGLQVSRISHSTVHQRSIMLFWIMALLKMGKIKGNNWKTNL